jgi:hypothetical protein
MVLAALHRILPSPSTFYSERGSVLGTLSLGSKEGGENNGAAGTGNRECYEDI